MVGILSWEVGNKEKKEEEDRTEDKKQERWKARREMDCKGQPQS